MKTSPRIRPNLSGIVLWCLDALFVLVFALLGLVLVVQNASGNFRTFLTVDGHVAPLWQSVLVANVLIGAMAALCWGLHLVLSSTRHNQPFSRRNVYILNAVGFFAFVLGLGTLGPTWHTVWTAAGHLQRVWISFDKAPQDLSGWLSHPSLWGIVVLAIAAVFGKGVDLQEQERRLREEQELTI